jgi:predicted nucleic acid-binding protein
MVEQAETVIITDADIIINLFNIGQLALFGSLPPYRFCVPREIMAELRDPKQQAAVRACIEAGHLGEMVVDTAATLPLFAGLRDLMGRGESACLALAMTGGFHIASDEKRRFRRKAIELIGEARILTTEFLLKRFAAGKSNDPIDAQII